MSIQENTRLSRETRSMNSALKDLECELNLPVGYLGQLTLADSDWDFIVKIGLVLEGLVSRALCLEMELPLRDKCIRKKTHYARLIIAERTELINEAEREMLVAISRLRNEFVHGLENLTRTLSEYFLELESTAKDDIAKSILGAGIPGRLREAEDPSAIKNFHVKFRASVMAAIFPTLLDLGYGHKLKKTILAHEEWREKKEKIYGKPLPPRTEAYLADKLMVLDLLTKSESQDQI